jgi:hypothetical protein
MFTYSKKEEAAMDKYFIIGGLGLIILASFILLFVRFMENKEKGEKK